MKEKACKNCIHYRAHYIKRKSEYHKRSEGHCVHPRLKFRDAETAACQHFKGEQTKEGS